MIKELTYYVSLTLDINAKYKLYYCPRIVHYPCCFPLPCSTQQRQISYLSVSRRPNNPDLLHTPKKRAPYQFLKDIPRFLPNRICNKEEELHVHTYTNEMCYIKRLVDIYPHLLGKNRTLSYRAS